MGEAGMRLGFWGEADFELKRDPAHPMATT